MKIQTRPSKHLLSAAFAVLISALPLHGDKRPNVVFILIDDISHYGVSAYGAKQLNSTEGFFESVPVATPEIDRLADEGVLAKNAFAYAICEPTRIALMTGMNNQRNFVQAKALHESHITFGDLFKRAGYITGIAGKWKQSRGSSTIPGDAYVDQFGWDYIHCFDLLYEGPRHIDPNFVINGKINWYKGLNPETKRRYYGPELVNRFALDFIEKHQDDPFFLYYPMLLVHDEHTPYPGHTTQ
jgi:arylsulfatase A-like enzyme